MIKAVIFDCFGVLTGDKWKEYVGSLPAEQRDAARSLNRRLDSGALDSETFYEEVHELTGDPAADIKAVINAEMYKNDNLLSYIATLKRDYKIGLLSNVSSDWVKHFLSESELELFDDVILSYEVRMTKHDPEIYKLASSRLKLENSECILVDDTKYYVDFAREQGMKSILYKDFSQMKIDLEKLLTKS